MDGTPMTPDPVTSYLATYGGPGKPAAPSSPPPKQIPLLASQDLDNQDPVTSYLQKYGKAAAQPQQKGSVADAIAQAISPFGLSDELGAGLSTAEKALHGDFNFKKNFADAQSEYQGNAESYARNHPTANNFIQAAGSIVPAATAAVATGGGSLPAEAAPLWARMVGGAAAGAGAEETQRIGTAHGSLMDRLQSAQKDGLPLGGMIFGAAAPAVPAAASSIMDRLKGQPASTKALGVIAKTIQKSGQTPEGVIQSLQGAPKDVPVMLADALGDPGRRLVRNVSDMGSLNASDLAQQLKDRNDTQFSRWVANTQKNSGIPFQSVDEAKAAFEKARGENANVAYGKAFAAPAYTGPALETALEDPLFKKAIAHGENIVATRQRAAQIRNGPQQPNGSPSPLETSSEQPPSVTPATTTPTDNPRSALWGRLLSLNGGDADKTMGAWKTLGYGKSDVPGSAVSSTGGGASAPYAAPYEVLDEAKKHIDEIVKTGSESNSSIKRSSAQAAQSLMSAVLQDADRQNKLYPAARAEYGDMSKPLNAIDAAEGFWHTAPEENAYNMAKVPPEGMEAFRIKAMADAKKKAGDAGDSRNLMNSWLNSPNSQENLKLFAPTPEAATNMQNFRDWEQKGALVHGALGGSQTSTNLMGAQALQQLAGPKSIAMALARPGRAMIRVASGVGGAIEKHQAHTLADALAPMLGTTRDQLPTLLERLSAAQRNAMLRDQTGRAIALQSGMEAGNNGQSQKP